MHQVLSLVIFLLNNCIISCLLNQGEEELKFLLIQGILHCKHVIIAIVKDQVCNALLTCVDCSSKSWPWGLHRLDLVWVLLLHMLVVSIVKVTIIKVIETTKALAVIISEIVLTCHDIDLHVVTRCIVAWLITLAIFITTHPRIEEHVVHGKLLAILGFKHVTMLLYVFFFAFSFVLIHNHCSVLVSSLNITRFFKFIF